MAKTAFLFPGQGAQYVTMGKDICDAHCCAREIFERAQAVTGLPIMEFCFDGPEEKLNSTDIAQPAIFTVSVALLEVMKKILGSDMPTPDVCAGLSLGEYTALYAAGAMDFETGVKLVARRGELMQAAATARPSGMVAVMGLSEQQAAELCEKAAQGQILTPANFNCPGQIVLSGENEPCQRAAELAPQMFPDACTGATVLKVAGAFHSEIMAPAAEELGKTLAQVKFNELKTPVIANVDAKFYASAAEIPQKLLAQLTGAVWWQQSMEALLADGMDAPYEIGPGKVLFGLMRRINRDCKVTQVNELSKVEKLKN